MHVKSPVGTFPVRIARPRIGKEGLRVPAAMGAWASEVTFDRGDTPIAAAIVSLLAGAFLLGRYTAPRPPR
jgi:hypothetical protein